MTLTLILCTFSAFGGGVVGMLIMAICSMARCGDCELERHARLCGSKTQPVVPTKNTWGSKVEP